MVNYIIDTSLKYNGIGIAILNSWRISKKEYMYFIKNQIKKPAQSWQKTRAYL